MTDPATKRGTNGNGIMAATEPVVRALLDRAKKKGYDHGVLGVRAVPAWEGPDRFLHDGRQVIVAPCPSTLAVWEALRERNTDGWLVILTPRDSADLGGGALSHFIGNWVNTPDPWQAVAQRFEADSLDPALYKHAEHKRVAAGLLDTMPTGGWPPAPGGVLTRDHALDAVVRAHLRLVERGVEVDVVTILQWSMKPEATTALADLRTLAGDPLTEVVIDWLAGRCGLAGRPVRALLRSGRVSDLVPLGLVAGLLAGDDPAVARAAGNFEGSYGFGPLPRDVLASWYGDAAGLTTQVLAPDVARRAIDSATTRLGELGISELADNSDLLTAGLLVRLGELARAITAVIPETDAVGDTSVISADLAVLDTAWERVREHHLAAADDTVLAFQSALRLVRWLAADVAVPDTLGGLLTRQVDSDAWVDSAVNDVVRGSADTHLAGALGAVLRLVRLRRAAHDLAFGAALAAVEEPGELVVERLLPDEVIPLARRQPVLLLVVDGLSVSVATELLTDATAAGWVEYGLPGRGRRSGALAVLPTLTQDSRCSLLCGELTQGPDKVERRGFAQLLKRSHLGSARPDVPLFHQKDLDTAPPGLSLAPVIQTAIADTEHRRLVAAVLNTVDDTLHHTDPGGTDWKLGTITHLKPLLEAARRAARTVVITSDHGHIIERRQGTLHQHDATLGARARAATGPAVDGEITVRGPRVLTENRTAVLAVDERIRYAAINAGYHGGGSPAEAVVPVFVLHAGTVREDAGLTPLGRVEPDWWTPATDVVVAAETPRPAPAKPAAHGRRKQSEGAGRFELPKPATGPAVSTVDSDAAALAKSVVTSKSFRQQLSIAGRIPLADDRITALLASLLAAPERRVSAERAADDLGITVGRLRGALPLLKRVLDVEGYVVVRHESASGEVVLDEAMLREQFGLGT
ncbi:MAG: BREX-2 system phosphatase PglZ [Pseudonocardiaceae bacterium]